MGVKKPPYQAVEINPPRRLLQGDAFGRTAEDLQSDQFRKNQKNPFPPLSRLFRSINQMHPPLPYSFIIIIFLFGILHSVTLQLLLDLKI